MRVVPLVAARVGARSTRRVIASWMVLATTIPITVPFTFTRDAGPAGATAMTGLERQRLVAHLEMTGTWLVDEVAGISPVQVQLRPAPGAWSIIEVIDHLLVAEPIYWRDLQRALKAPPIRQTLGGTDDDILWYGIDRTARQKAVAAEEPKGQLRDLDQGLKDFRALHAQMLQYVRTTSDDLRSHVVAREGCDAYQWLLLISAHRQRHVLQIREIKADRRFPKK